jgi:hypothetical protein
MRYDKIYFIDEQFLACYMSIIKIKYISTFINLHKILLRLYMCVCVCVCVCARARARARIYIYIYVSDTTFFFLSYCALNRRNRMVLRNFLLNLVIMHSNPSCKTMCRCRRSLLHALWILVSSLLKNMSKLRYIKLNIIILKFNILHISYFSK